MQTQVSCIEKKDAINNQKWLPICRATVLMLGFWVAFAQGEEFRYQYINLRDKVPPLPDGVSLSYFEAKRINDRRQVSGTISYCALTCKTTVGIYQKGQTRPLQPGATITVGPINQRGHIGGRVILNPVNINIQAAIISEKGMELIPPLPGEIVSSVIALNDNNTALVESLNKNFTSKKALYLYSGGNSKPLDFGPNISSTDNLGMNNQALISGTTFNKLGQTRGFRFDPGTGKTQLLKPKTTDETHTNGLGINGQGNVLGYSFTPNSLKRVGFWGRSGKFYTYFIEGTSEYPTISNRLFFNDKNQIVITNISSPATEVGISYLVPRPGLRLNIADLVVNKDEMPPESKISYIRDINNHGDMIGDDLSNSSFLLQRIDD